MTIHEAQGSSFDRVGIFLSDDVFAHGQLYTALSRGRSFESVEIVLENKQDFVVRNIVESEFLN